MMQVQDYRCCALPEGHEGMCAWICHDCGGTARCWYCNDECDDLGCPECSGNGACGACFEGMISS